MDVPKRSSVGRHSKGMYGLAHINELPRTVYRAMSGEQRKRFSAEQNASSKKDGREVYSQTVVATPEGVKIPETGKL